METNAYSPASALAELRERFRGEFCRVQIIDEFWPAGVGKGPSETSHKVIVQVGWPGGQKFSAETLDETMEELWTWHSENSLCGECTYPVDSVGLCVMDTGHTGYRPQV